MASGYKSTHPVMAKNLKNINIPSEKVTQGFGFAKASVGFHSPEGWVDDEYGHHQYSSCVDLSASLGFTAELKSRLVAAGFCPFFRNWEGNRHIHCVYVGLSTVLDGPKSQIMDYYNGLDGLVGHRKLTGKLSPSNSEKAIIKAAFNASDGHNTVKVMLNDQEIHCYAFMGKVPGTPREVTRCELRPFVEYFKADILDGKHLLYKGKTIDFSNCNPQLEGQFTRVDLRSIAHLLDLNISNFQMKNNIGIATLIKV